jgi:hypothetical protein
VRLLPRLGREWVMVLPEDHPLYSETSGIYYHRDNAFSDASQFGQVAVQERRVLRFRWKVVLLRGWDTQTGWDRDGETPEAP